MYRLMCQTTLVVCLGTRRVAHCMQSGNRSLTTTMEAVQNGRDTASLASHFRWMKVMAPEFRVRGDQITVLHDPSEFYNTIKEQIGIARKSVVLASLYLGDGPMEQELVSCLRQACQRSLTDKEQLSVHVLLDCVRGSRGKSNSRTMLLPLIREFRDRVSVSLYHTPELRGAKKALIPERFNEAIGLSHLKVYTFDDNLLMSGANLSEMYFSNRQDRYILIRDCPELVSFFNRLVLGVSSVSFQLHSDNSLSLFSDTSIHPVKGNIDQFKQQACRAVTALISPGDTNGISCSVSEWQRTMLENSRGDLMQEGRNTHHPRPISGRTEDAADHSSVGNGALSNDRRTSCGVSESGRGSANGTGAREGHPDREAGLGQEPVVQGDNGRRRTRNESQGAGNCVMTGNDGSPAKQSRMTAASEAEEVSSGKDTVIYPLVQMGPFGVTVDQEVTRRLLGEGDGGAVCYLASGYFNLTSEYMDTILQSKPTFEILMASPQVNGFYGSRGISGYIPDSYTFIACQFFGALCRRGLQHRIRLYEYYRDSWTFHVKGLWYYLPGQRLPTLTLIGSPNFGHRSVHRDLEAQLAIVTQNDSLREQLHTEQERLYARSQMVTGETFTKPDRKVPLWTKLVVSITRNFF
ncbi:CDP-diacylglycerol--glycerol-3-phosphate 3-phosphatidyltransferase, mitochondrial-like [Diadema antillarum]|uniref:CDP-diacylglycerol--glycerol-3-phosphate 3-phosphatidyltransferase, mitochondrial-like n=1 Tax=Diadema antillarum TaxID=105358 RepID=UPI003A841B1C